MEPVAVVARAGCTTNMLVAGLGRRNHQTHYWALRQQARYLFVPLWETGDRVWLSLHLWWWGVVFDLWIVVASINGMRCPCVGGVFFCAIFEKLWFLCL